MCLSFYEMVDRLPPQLPDDGWCRHSVGAICHDSCCTMLELLNLVECHGATNTRDRATDKEIRQQGQHTENRCYFEDGLLNPAEEKQTKHSQVV